MRVQIIGMLFLFNIISCSKNNISALQNNTNTSFTPIIAGGRNNQDTTHTNVMRIGVFANNTTSYCTGVLVANEINNVKVVTAASCLMGVNASNINVTAYDTTQKPGSPIKVADISLPPELSSQANKNALSKGGLINIAVLSLQSQVQISGQNVVPMPVFNTGLNQSHINQPIAVVGYGASTPSGQISSTIERRINTSNYTIKNLQMYHFLTGDVAFSFGLCGTGDVGDAAIMTVNGNDFLVGIASSPLPEDQCRVFDLFTRVDIFYKFITNQGQNNTNPFISQCNAIPTCSNDNKHILNTCSLGLFVENTNNDNLSGTQLNYHKDGANIAFPCAAAPYYGFCEANKCIPFINTPSNILAPQILMIDDLSHESDLNLRLGDRQTPYLTLSYVSNATTSYLHINSQPPSAAYFLTNIAEDSIDGSSPNFEMFYDQFQVDIAFLDDKSSVLFSAGSNAYNLSLNTVPADCTSTNAADNFKTFICKLKNETSAIKNIKLSNFLIPSGSRGLNIRNIALSNSGSYYFPLPHPPSHQPSYAASNLTIHPEKIGFYMVPDLVAPYVDGAGNCTSALQKSLIKLHQLFPNTLIRFDNETGHQPPNFTESFIACANTASVDMMITASAVDGYNNCWANSWAHGYSDGRCLTPVPNSILNIANGPYLSFIAQKYQQYSNVKLVETLCEPDGNGWFYNDSDNVADFDVYMTKLIAAMGLHTKAIVGPSAAYQGSKIFNNFLSNYAAITSNLSYHTYGGYSSLNDYSGHDVYITEYGFNNAMDPGFVLNDLWYAENKNKLSNTIKMLHYVQLIGGNRPGFTTNTVGNNRFEFGDWLLALAMYQVLGAVSNEAYIDTSNPYFIATDDGQGNTAILIWNNSGSSMTNQTINIPGVSASSVNNFSEADIKSGAYAITCQSSLNWASAQITAGNLQIIIKNLPAHSAMLLTTKTNSCNNLSD